MCILPGCSVACCESSLPPNQLECRKVVLRWLKDVVAAESCGTRDLSGACWDEDHDLWECPTDSRSPVGFLKVNGGRLNS